MTAADEPVIYLGAEMPHTDAERVLSSALVDGVHRYVSTYCVHGRCDACRLACKTCQAPCLHDCHSQET